MLPLSGDTNTSNCFDLNRRKARSPLESSSRIMAAAFLVRVSNSEPKEVAFELSNVDRIGVPMKAIKPIPYDDTC